MSVIVKDMDMPSGCCQCPLTVHGTLQDGFARYCGVTLTECSETGAERLPDCPLFELHDWREL